jgi:hypothetical protein
MTDKKACGNPIWCDSETKEFYRKRAARNHRTMGNELAAIREDLEREDKITALNVPVLDEKKTGELK